MNYLKNTSILILAVVLLLPLLSSFGGNVFLFSANATSSTSTSTTKQTLVYMSGINYDQAVKYYAEVTSGEGQIKALGPQVYAVSTSGNLYLFDKNFYPSEFTNLAHSHNFKVIPLIVAGSGLCSGAVYCNDKNILKIITSPTQLNLFREELVSTAKQFGFDGWQLDWETSTLGTGYKVAMTTALNSLANALHSMTPRRTLSLTTYYRNYESGPYNTWTLSEGSIDQLNIQAYTGSLSSFKTWVGAMLGGMAVDSKLAIGLGDYMYSNPTIAGYCMQYILQHNAGAVSVWPSWGKAMSFGWYGYHDPVYSTKSYYGLFQVFLTR